MTDRWIFHTPGPAYDEQINYGPGEFDFARLRLPHRAGPHALIVYLHGGFWRSFVSLEHAEHVCAALTRLGFATYCVEYPRTGQVGGGWPGSFKAVGQAVDTLPRLAPRFDLDLGRLVVMGHSAGGQLAQLLAGRPQLVTNHPLYTLDPLPIKGVISLAGVSDLVQGYRLGLGEEAVAAFMGGSPDALPDQYREATPLNSLPLGLPQLLIHGDDDKRVPFAFSQEYQTRAQALGDWIELVRLAGAGHFDLIDPHSAAWPVVEQSVLDFMAQFET